MKLNHLNLTVTDAQAARRFFEKYFGLKSIEGTTDDATFLALRDDDGFTLTIMEAKNTAVVYPKTFHIGFLVHDENRVMDIYNQMKEDGYDVPPPKKYRGNTLDFYFTTPYGFTIQVS